MRPTDLCNLDVIIPVGYLGTGQTAHHVPGLSVRHSFAA